MHSDTAESDREDLAAARSRFLAAKQARNACLEDSPEWDAANTAARQAAVEMQKIHERMELHEKLQRSRWLEYPLD
jgi:hypothetical protein